jgi:NarL family two-component system sensor histidine kinase LiaS
MITSKWENMFTFFKGLRGKLIFTYVSVTVLTLLILEILVVAAGILLSGLADADEKEYLSDVVVTLYPQARQYLQPGKEDLTGLQDWLDQVLDSGYASLEPQNIFDSPVARIADDTSLYVLSLDKKILAQTPSGSDNRVGQIYAPPFPAAEELMQYALEGNRGISKLNSLTAAGNYWLVVPVNQTDWESALVGLIIVEVEPPPPMFQQILPSLVGAILITGVLLLIAVVPFGALFGLIMSGGLTKRLAALTSAADSWAQGDFRPMPTDHTQDEIGLLNRRMRNMVERIQGLLQDKQALAQLEERNRLARELHDTVKQQTFATLMQVRAARNQLKNNPHEVEQHLLEAEGLIKASQQELSLMINELRPAALKDQGLQAALETYLENWSTQACIPSTFQALNTRKLSLDVEQALYRVAQEALANTARHSRASAVTLLLECNPESVRLEVSDNGIGFDPLDEQIAGYGLQSMQERLASLHGILEVNSVPGEGTMVVAKVPLPGNK